MKEHTKGRIHSVESFGAVDGPGIRFVVFLQGCQLRCLYCHNPDSWDTKAGIELTAKQVVDDIESYLNFIKKGGVTLSGGEPLLQLDFAYEIIMGCKELGLHTAIDTAGSTSIERSKKVIDAADLLILDAKTMDAALNKSLCGSKTLLKNFMDTLNYCEKTSKPVWIRHVLLPGYTDNEKGLNELASYLSAYKCIQKTEILPFHKMGEYKWQELSYEYKLQDIAPPSAESIERATQIFKKYNLIK